MPVENTDLREVSDFILSQIQYVEYHLTQVILKNNLGAGEMVQYLRALTTVPETPRITSRHP